MEPIRELIHLKTNAVRKGKKVNFNWDTAQLLVLVFRERMVRLGMSSHDCG